MSPRRAQLVLLCEDRQHGAFLRRFLERCGFDKRALRVQMAPGGRGSAEQWVRERYPEEVRALRCSHVHRGLIVCIDEDTGSTAPRARQLADALAANGQAPRAPSEPILHAIPARNIETWLAYLTGETVDAVAEWPKRARQSQCQEEAKALKAMCDAGALRAPAPLSLEAACVEYRDRMP